MWPKGKEVPVRKLVESAGRSKASVTKRTGAVPETPKDDGGTLEIVLGNERVEERAGPVERVVREVQTPTRSGTMKTTRNLEAYRAYQREYHRKYRKLHPKGK